ncbi:MAG: MlaD family protein [Archangium sp.]|nr:MlaD family protein [Archangium sp.]
MDARVLPLVLVLGCAKPPLHAVLEQAEGLTKGSRVYAAGVSVGEVEAVRLEGVQADVSFKLREGNTLSLRIDACAMSLPEDGSALLLLFPGKELERLSANVPACELNEHRLVALRQLANSGGGALSQAIRRYFAELRTTAPLVDGPKACGALEVSRLRIEEVSAVPLLLPSGGKRLWLAVENRGESPGSLETATFLDSRGTIAQVRVPEAADLFTSVTIPAGARREVSAIFEGSRANQVSAVEVKASFEDAGCSVRWRL